MPTSTAAVLPTIRPLAEHRRRSRPQLVILPVHRPVARPVPPPAAPDIATVRRVLTGVLEVMEGRRSPGQLTGLLPCRYQRALLNSPLATGPGARRLRSLHMSRTTADTVDICARVEHRGRSRALTGRLTHQADRWTFTQLEVV